MSHYRKIAVVILRSVGCRLVIYSLAGVLYGVGHTLLFGSRETFFVSFVTNMLSCLTYMLVGAAPFVLSRPPSHLIAGRLRGE
ncbi:MAG TPA: hypothetical protein VKB12_06045 [Pyrinomonadaceae bacterium]|nr:hypothetical protein [Pyrinomonadaceae bacterium]